VARRRVEGYHSSDAEEFGLPELAHSVE
jgi:hypothetical protein